MVNYEEIRGLQRKEKNAARIVELKDDYYKQLADYVKDGSKKLNPAELRTLENVMKIARDLFDSREQKILMKALRTVRTGEYDDHGMTTEERHLYDKAVNSLKEHRKFFDKVLVGEYRHENLLKEENNNIVLVRILKEIPKFTGSDSKEYGPFALNAIAKLPQKEAQFLSDQNLVEVM